MSFWDRIREIASGVSSFLVSDETKVIAKETLRNREAWEDKRATRRRPRHIYRIPAEIFARTHYLRRPEFSATRKLPRPAKTYRAARRNAKRTRAFGGMGSVIERRMY